MNPALSGLPAFLAREGGLHSGLMMAHVTAAALVSENKVLAHPASVDSIPTSAGKEDHVSMGPTAAWKAARVVANTGARAGRRAARGLRGPRVPAAAALLRAARGRARARARAGARPTGRTACSARRSRPSRTCCATGAVLDARRGGLRYAGVDARPSPACAAPPGSPGPCSWSSPPASSRRSPTRSAASRWPLSRASARGSSCSSAGSSGSGSAGPSPARAARPTARRFRVVPGGKGNGHDHDATKDDGGDKPRWVM